ncbi:sugar lactone lactonase YvrE [Phytomonospora endophytica]|uniref:Sugar lactone lactonase YvrE n=1 Tax=Phytomonospora endophytica TaxID=714109 RepID=A0A841FXB2_9ACTN|nr:sugar lactone lactonase YvrE [Phytomonospora endophytica]GIG67366.1 hypothetical protein Pen01_36610 [Phytomonospora endophytica]
MRKSISGLLLAATVAAGVAASPASVSAHPIPAVIEGHADSLHPEGVAYDPTRGAFLVTSLKHGTVSAVDRDGVTRTLVDDPALIETIGLQVDLPRGRILVASGDQGVGDRTSPATRDRTAGLGVYSLRTGERIAYVDLAAVAADGGGHFANDIAVAPDGTAYVTDTAAGIVYRVDVAGRASVLVRDERLTFAGGFGANGIVYRAGVLIVGNYSAGTLWRIPVARPQLRQVRLDRGGRARHGLGPQREHGRAAVGRGHQRRVHDPAVLSMRGARSSGPRAYPSVRRQRSAAWSMSWRSTWKKRLVVSIRAPAALSVPRRAAPSRVCSAQAVIDSMLAFQARYQTSSLIR